MGKKLCIFVAVGIAAIGPGGASSATTGNVVVMSATSVAGHPSVTWTLAPGWCSNVVEVAKNPAVGTDGSFITQNVIDYAVVSVTQTTWLSSSQGTLSPGTYYVHVQAYGCDFSAWPAWSPTVIFSFQATLPPPAPPRVALVIKNETGEHTLSSVMLGQTVEVDAKVTGSLGSLPAWDERGKLCVRTSSGASCMGRGGASFMRVTRKSVIRSRFTVYACLDGRVLATRSLPVRRTISAA